MCFGGNINLPNDIFIYSERGSEERGEERSGIKGLGTKRRVLNFLSGCYKLSSHSNLVFVLAVTFYVFPKSLKVPVRMKTRTKPKNPPEPPDGGTWECCTTPAKKDFLLGVS